MSTPTQEIAILEARLKELKEKYGLAEVRKPKEKTRRIERCSECNTNDVITNLVRISNNEYVHSRCVQYIPEPVAHTIKRKIYNLSLSLDIDSRYTDKDIIDIIEYQLHCKCRVLTERIAEI